jgi:hypothetical protein
MRLTKWLLPVELAALALAAWFFGDSGVLVVIALTLFGLTNFLTGAVLTLIGRYPHLFSDEV